MDTSPLIDVKNIKVCAQGIEILKDFSFMAQKGQIHVIMGPNGCGKSSFSKVLAGHPSYGVTQGEIFFKNQNLLLLPAQDRAKQGMFLAFQNPLEICGLSTFDFLHVVFNEKQKFLEKRLIEPLEFLTYLKFLCEKLKFSENFLHRNFNEGFSGGEKKKMEILQMFILDPDLIILDELDSGLDIDALRILFESIQNHYLKKKEKTIIIITHNVKIFDYITPDFVHIMGNGKITKTGNISLLKDLEKTGYNSY